MSKRLTLMLSLLLVVALVQMPLAGSNCSGVKKTASTEAKMVSGDKAHCTATDAAACAAKMGMTVEECQALCASGDFTVVEMSVKGMTCTGCENTITAALKELPGVVHVGKVSYEEGMAYVMIDAKKAKTESLVSAVSGKGYKAEVVPAVATTSTVNDAKGKACSITAKKGCDKPCSTPCGAKKAKTDDKAEGEGTL